jgi:ADP-ribose pyrophosphatase
MAGRAAERRRKKEAGGMLDDTRLECEKIPRSAKRVFKGVIYDVYRWRQRMFDGSYTVFERLRRPNTAAVIAVSKSRIFIACEEQPRSKREIGLFTGRAAKNEEPIATARRELLEESGLASEDWELLEVFEPSPHIDWSIYLFAAKGCRKVKEPHLDSGERIEVRTVDFKGFMSLAHRFGGDIGNYLSEIGESKAKTEKLRKKLLG